jgi:hypothetical protein
LWEGRRKAFLERGEVGLRVSVSVGLRVSVVLLDCLPHHEVDLLRIPS